MDGGRCLLCGAHWRGLDSGVFCIGRLRIESLVTANALFSLMRFRRLMVLSGAGFPACHVTCLIIRNRQQLQAAFRGACQPVDGENGGI